MGVYSENRIFGSAVEAPEPDMSYGDIDGANRIMAEMVQDELDFFDDVIRNDIQQAYMEHAINEGSDYLLEDLQVLQEGAVGNLFKKLGAFLKKLWAKVVGFFKGVINKLGYITADNKKLVSKYSKQINRKVGLDKMEFKWRADKDLDFMLKPEDKPENRGHFELGDLVHFVNDQASVNASDVEDFRKKLEKAEDHLIDDADDIRIDFINNVCLQGKAPKVTEASGAALTKELIDHYLDDEDTRENFSQLRGEIENTLTNSKKYISSLEKTKSNIDSWYSKQISTIDKLARHYESKDVNVNSSFINNKTADKDVSGLDVNSSARKATENMRTTRAQTASLVSKAATLLSKKYSLQQSCILAVSSAHITAMKMYIKQCRRVYQQALGYTYNKEDVDLVLDMEDIEAISDFETDSLWNEG